MSAGAGNRDEIRIFDTALPDGQQSPGAAMTPEEMLTVARLPGRMGVDIIKAAFPVSRPDDFEAVTEGTDARANVSVRLEENGRTVTGRAADTYKLPAAANAYVNALNGLLVKREKQVPETLTVAR
jgi:isopropylmalate/homocitrate/citramalate synthase